MYQSQSIINLMRVIMANPCGDIRTHFRAKALHDALGGMLYKGDELREIHDALKERQKRGNIKNVN